MYLFANPVGIMALIIGFAAVFFIATIIFSYLYFFNPKIKIVPNEIMKELDEVEKIEIAKIRGKIPEAEIEYQMKINKLDAEIAKANGNKNLIVKQTQALENQIETKKKELESYRIKIEEEKIFLDSLDDRQGEIIEEIVNKFEGKKRTCGYKKRCKTI